MRFAALPARGEAQVDFAHSRTAFTDESGAGDGAPIIFVVLAGAGPHHRIHSVTAALLWHMAPLGWEHMSLTGDYI